MATLYQHKSGIYYIISGPKAKRVWRSLYTRDRKEAFQLYLKHEAADRGERRR